MSFRFSMHGQVLCDGRDDGIDCRRGLPGVLLVFGNADMPADVEPGREIERVVMMDSVLPVVTGQHFGWSFVTWGDADQRRRAVYCPGHRAQARSFTSDLNASGFAAECKTHTPRGNKTG